MTTLISVNGWEENSEGIIRKTFNGTDELGIWGVGNNWFLERKFKTGTVKTILKADNPYVLMMKTDAHYNDELD